MVHQAAPKTGPQTEMLHCWPSQFGDRFLVRQTDPFLNCHGSCCVRFPGILGRRKIVDRVASHGACKLNILPADALHFPSRRSRPWQKRRGRFLTPHLNKFLICGPKIGAVFWPPFFSVPTPGSFFGVSRLVPRVHTNGSPARHTSHPSQTESLRRTMNANRKMTLKIGPPDEPKIGTQTVKAHYSSLQFWF